MTIENSLSKFGHAFQMKCIVALLNSKEFLEQSLDCIDPKYFEAEALQWICTKILWYYTNYKELASILVLKNECDKLQNQEVLQLSIIENLKELFYVQNSNLDDLEYVKTELLTFCKNQALKNAVLKSADLLQRGDYNQIKTTIDAALKVGQDKNIGHVWKEEFDNRMNRPKRLVIPTPWKCINDLMEGGLGPGELGCIVSGSGLGKTWLLNAIATYAAKIGNIVPYYTLELSEDYIGKRMDTIFSGIETSKLKDHQKDVQEIINSVPGQIIVKYFPARSITVNNLRAHLEKLKNLDKKPSMMIIDYPDLMNSLTKSGARHEELGYIYEEIRGLAGENQLPCWIVSQSNRHSMEENVISADKIAGSFAKIMTADFVGSLSRKTSDKIVNTARFHIIKNRFGKDGDVFPVEMDLAHGKIEIFDEGSIEGRRIKSKIDSGEGAIKQILAKKFIELHEPQNPQELLFD